MQHTLKNKNTSPVFLLWWKLKKKITKKTELDLDGYYSPSWKRHKLQNLPPFVLIVVKIKKERKKGTRDRTFLTISTRTVTGDWIISTIYFIFTYNPLSILNFSSGSCAARKSFPLHLRSLAGPDPVPWLYGDRQGIEPRRPSCALGCAGHSWMCGELLLR